MLGWPKEHSRRKPQPETQRTLCHHPVHRNPPVYQTVRSPTAIYNQVPLYMSRYPLYLTMYPLYTSCAGLSHLYLNEMVDPEFEEMSGCRNHSEPLGIVSKGVSVFECDIEEWGLGIMNEEIDVLQQDIVGWGLNLIFWDKLTCASKYHFAGTV